MSDTTPARRKPAPMLEAANPIMQMAIAASDRGDFEALEKLLDIRDREDKRAAVTAFNRAFSAMQAELPVIPKRGEGHNGVRHALIEDIFSKALPVCAKHGMSLRHTITQPEDGKGAVTVTAILAHVDGHAETATMVAAADTSGSKNAIQAVKSTITYGRRTTAEAVLGLTSHGEDDDAYRAGVSDAATAHLDAIESANTIADLSDVNLAIKRDQDLKGTDLANVMHVWTVKGRALQETQNA